MSFNFGGSSGRSRGTTTVIMPPSSPEERELRRLNIELAKIQAGEYLRALQEDEAFRASPLFQTQRAIEAKASENILARLEGRAPVLAPEEQERLDTIFGNTQREGEESLQRFAEEIAASRGLNVADSPIGNEALRQQREFIQNLGAQKAASAFDLGNAATAFSQAQQQFANQLRQQAYMNRLAFASQTPSSFGFQGNLFAERLGQAGRSFTGSQSGFQWGGGVSARDAGGFMQGLGGLGVGA